MDDTARFRFNEPRVINEVLDGELIIVQFETGCYYSIQGVGADVCQSLSAGFSLAEIIQTVAAHFGVSPAQIAPEIQNFVRQLIDEQLLVSAEARGRNGSAKLTAASYSAPSFEKFDDMAEQLLLDPIHEIGETGWPVRHSA